jgi:protein-S-isoprenylcysteine O-methyltransferase Ste14
MPLLSFALGLVIYAAGVASMGYLVGFSANLLVPKGIDGGLVAPWPEALAVNLLLLGVFGLQHSLMARPGFKRWWTRTVPQPLERSSYVLATALVLALLFWQWRAMPEPVVWQVETPIVAGLLWSLFGLGWVLALVSTFLINHFELFGLQQLAAQLTGRTPAPGPFRTPLLYRYVRHPLYLGLLLGLWATPRMTAGHLLFAAGLTVYILIGVSFEERDLVAQFGERYRRYRAEVGMLWPRRRRS